MRADFGNADGFAVSSVIMEERLFLHLARGRAMAPVIPHRALVGIAPCGAGDLVPGDVVAFDEGGGVVLSRLGAPG
ncbi:MAG: hypothetical protein ACYC9Y_16360, partial [Candidatus Methylomirabilia bacterium]